MIGPLKAPGASLFFPAIGLEIFLEIRGRTLYPTGSCCAPTGDYGCLVPVAF